MLEYTYVPAIDNKQAPAGKGEKKKANISAVENIIIDTAFNLEYHVVISLARTTEQEMGRNNRQELDELVGSLVSIRLEHTSMITVRPTLDPYFKYM